jgi:hypothetical protein
MRLPSHPPIFSEWAGDRKEVADMRSPPRLLILALLGVLVAIGGQFAEGSGSSDFESPLVITAADFKNNGADVEGYHFHRDGRLEGSGSTVYMVAPVYLPNGAVVRKVVAYVYDNNDSCDSPDIEVVVAQHDLAETNVTLIITSAQTTGASGAVQEISGHLTISPPIDNINFAYWVTVTLCSTSHNFHSVAIYYTE